MQLPIQRLLTQLLFSPRCIGCNTRGAELCTRCISTIPSAPPTGESGIFGIYDYGNPLVSKGVWQLKYHKKKGVVVALAQAGRDTVLAILEDLLQTATREDVVFVPTPQHPDTTKVRGFNQSEIIATLFSDCVPDSVVLPLLKKVRVTVPQAHIHHKTERLRNVRESCTSTKTPLDPEVLYIVVDDVTTTGATIHEAVRALKAAGAQRVLGIALAHGYKHRGVL